MAPRIRLSSLSAALGLLTLISTETHGESGVGYAAVGRSEPAATTWP